jgi:hypothetical protein
MTTRRAIIIGAIASALVALAINMPRPSAGVPCESTLQEDVLNCTFTLGEKK